MRLLVLGGGMMGRAAAYDMVRQDDVEQVAIADVSEDVASEAVAVAGSGKALGVPLDVTDRAATRAAMAEAEATLSCVSYRFNLDLAKHAVEVGTHFVDLGGNNAVVEGELKLDAEAKAKGVAIIPDCGLAPGMVSLLAMRGLEQMDTIDRIRLRVGGLPAEPKPPLDYMIVFSVHGLVNEYIEPCVALRGGRLVEIESMTEIEEIEFPEPFGTLEAFHTSGGCSTLPKTLLGQVRDLDYKTIRYPGHAAKIKAMIDLGLTSSEPIDAGGARVAPRDVLEACLESALPHEGEDVILLRVTVEGTRDGRGAVARFEMIDRADPETGLSAMMRGTSCPASIVTLMAARGEIAPGAVRQELAINSQRFMDEFIARGMPLESRFDIEP